MIEVLNKKKKLVGYVDGKRYLDKKKNLISYLENNEFKDNSGYTLLILREDGDITWNVGETQGSIKDGKIYSYYQELVIFEYVTEEGKFVDPNGNAVLYLNGDLEILKDEDLFGIAGQYLELFS
ncbi:MAG: hypothetical protein ACFFEN_07310 [Candidatus Thorarchaeota archaeon]